MYARVSGSGFRWVIGMKFSLTYTLRHRPAIWVIEQSPPPGPRTCLIAYFESFVLLSTTLLYTSISRALVPRDEPARLILLLCALFFQVLPFHSLLLKPFIPEHNHHTSQHTLPMDNQLTTFSVPCRIVLFALFLVDS